MTLLLLLLLLQGVVVSGGREVFSEGDAYSLWLRNHSLRLQQHGGDWLRAAPEDCREAPLCVSDRLLGNITWHSSPPLSVRTSSASCQHLKKLNYKKIYFIGDSFMRHIYQAFLLILSGDYDFGSLNHRIESCKGEYQFAEKRCSGINAFVKSTRSVCSKEIQLAFFDVFNFKSSPHVFPLNDPEAILLWSEGSHPAFFNYTNGGRNNFALYQEKFLHHYTICQERSRKPSLPRNVKWLSTHLRPFKGMHDEEKLSVILEYNKAMKEFFLSGKCGAIQYIDVFNMTHALQLPPIRKNLWKKVNGLTYDGMHFARTINVLKALIVLNTIT